jgi:hypothetical protein
VVAGRDCLCQREQAGLSRLNSARLIEEYDTDDGAVVAQRYQRVVDTSHEATGLDALPVRAPEVLHLGKATHRQLPLYEGRQLTRSVLQDRTCGRLASRE